MESKEVIEMSEFAKLDLRIGKIVNAERKEGEQEVNHARCRRGE